MLEQSETTNKAIQNELKSSQVENSELKNKIDKIENVCERRQNDLEKIRADLRCLEDANDKLSKYHNYYSNAKLSQNN